MIPPITTLMSIFQWKDEYNVGNAEIDTQHKRLFQLAGELHAAMTAGKGNKALGDTLNSLIEYTKHHFACEEKLMQKFQYPEYAEHKALHDDLTARVLEFQRDFESGKTAMGLELSQILKDWLGHHVGETDQKVSTFLKTKAA